MANDLAGLNPCRKVRWGGGQTGCARERAHSHTDAFTLRDLLWHADVKMTGIYTNPQFEEARGAVEALSSSGGGIGCWSSKPGEKF